MTWRQNLKLFLISGPLEKTHNQLVMGTILIPLKIMVLVCRA